MRKQKFGNSNRRTNAMTLTEVLVILAVIAVLAAMLIPATTPNRRAAQRNYCINNLKQTVLGFRVWEGDQDIRFPMQVSVEQNGAKELVVTGNVAAVFEVMSNELSTPKLLFCPADITHRIATNFTTDFGNKSISYFVGLDASGMYNNPILVGDDNFEVGRVPVKSGVLLLSTNTSIAWTGERHRFAGNIALVDGSVQQTTVSSLTNAIIKQYEPEFDFTNRFRWAIP